MARASWSGEVRRSEVGRRAGRSATLGLLAAACLLPSPARSTDLDEVQKRGSLRVLLVYDAKRPEFFSAAAGGRPGFDHEVLQGFASLHKWTLDLVPVGAWDELIPALLDKQGDLIAGRFTATPARRKLVSFCFEVFPTRNVVFNRKPASPITTLDQLRALKVGTIKGTSMAEAIAAAGVPASHVDDGLPAGGFAEALKSGRVSAAVWGVESAIALSREDPDLQLGMFLGTPGSLAYAVRKDEPALLQALDEYVENLRRTQTWSRLVVKYFGEAGPRILKQARAQ